MAYLTLGYVMLLILCLSYGAQGQVSVEDGSYGLDGPAWCDLNSMEAKANFHAYNGEGQICYSLFTNKKNVGDARSTCEQYGGILATVASEATTEFLKKSFAHVPDGALPYIGLVDLRNKGSWRWVNGMKLQGYENWEHGSRRHGGACVRLSEKGQWLPTKCHVHSAFLCESQYPDVRKAEIYEGSAAGEVLQTAKPAGTNGDDAESGLTAANSASDEAAVAKNIGLIHTMKARMSGDIRIIRESNQRWYNIYADMLRRGKIAAAPTVTRLDVSSLFKEVQKTYANLVHWINDVTNQETRLKVAVALLTKSQSILAKFRSKSYAGRIVLERGIRKIQRRILTLERRTLKLLEHQKGIWGIVKGRLKRLDDLRKREKLMHGTIGKAALVADDLRQKSARLALLDQRIAKEEKAIDKMQRKDEKSRAKIGKSTRKQDQVLADAKWELDNDKTHRKRFVKRQKGELDNINEQQENLRKRFLDEARYLSEKLSPELVKGMANEAVQTSYEKGAQKLVVFYEDAEKDILQNLSQLFATVKFPKPLHKAMVLDLMDTVQKRVLERLKAGHDGSE